MRENLHKVKKKILNWAESSTAHGIPNIVRNENWSIKIIWILFFTASAVYSSILVIRSIVGYLEYNVNTVVTFKRETHLEFPTVSFCNLNPYNSNHDDSVVLGLVENVKKRTINETNLKDRELAIENINYDIMRILKRYNESGELKHGFFIEDMLMSCRYELNPCNSSDFDHFYSPYYGNCYKFNSGLTRDKNKALLRKIYSTGRANGLKLEIFVGNPSYYDVTKSNGIILFVHNYSIDPLTLNEGITISTDLETNVVINKINILKQPYPFSNCIKNLRSRNEFNSELYKKTFNKYKYYTQKFCVSNCYQKYIFENCKCYDNQFEGYNEGDPCESDMFECLAYYFTLFKKSQITNCFKECPDECETIKFDLTTSSSNFPSLFYADLIMKSQEIYPRNINFTSFEHIKETVLAVNVNFGETAYLLIEETPSKTFDQLLSETGGVLGLCIGCSLLSVVEVVELAIEIIFIIARSDLRKNDVKKFNY